VSQGALKLIEVNTPHARWQVLPDCREQLFGPDGLRLEEWLRSGLAHVVKHGPHRTVYRVALPGLSFYLKHYRLPDFRARLRQLVRPAKARMEFERVLAVAARSVPTVSPLALGEGNLGPASCDSFLITRSLENSEAVSSFIETTLPRLRPDLQTRLRQRLAIALGEFVAHLHEAGIVHRDLHAANMLIRSDGQDELSLHLVDLHAVNLGEALGWRVSRHNLVLLNRWFVLRSSRSDRYRFWRAYCRARFGGSQEVGAIAAADRGPRLCPSTWRDLARDLEEQTWKSNLRFWRKRDRRCLASNRHYQRLRTSAVVGYAVRELEAGALAALLANPDAPFQQPGVELLKNSRSSTVAEFDLPVDGVLRRVIYKRFKVTSWSDPWLAMVRHSPAVRSWINGHGLRERCLPTARPLAVWHRRRGPLAYEGYLLTEKIVQAQDLHAFVDGLSSLDTPQGRKDLRWRIEQVAQLVCGLHRRQISHRDLKAVNILLTKTEIWFIDLVGVVPCRTLSWRRRIQNLARLHASFHQSSRLTRTDKLRFLRAYLQWGLFGKGGWKQWWRQIATETQAKIRRNARNGRPLV
jgi:tRNA A-37 threonylcarbamoyl transferase component Bud32